MIVHRYALRAAAARGRPGDRLPARGALRRRARDDLDRGAGLRRPPRRVARRPAARPAGRRLRPRLRDDGARLPRARAGGRARRLGRRRSTTRAPSRATTSSPRSATASGSTPRASGSSSRRSRPGRTRAGDPGRRARSTSSRRAAAARRWTWCSSARTAPRCPSSRSPARGASKPTDMMLPSLEVAGPGGHWVEVSRAICPGEPSDETKRMLEAYDEYFDAARKDAARRRDRARRPPGGREGLPRPRLPARPRHRPLDRDDDDRVPEDRRGRRDGAAENMVFSMHPHAISQDGSACLYMQDTWLVTADGGVPLADLPLKIYDGTESAPVTEPKLSEPVLPGEGGSDYERYLRTDELLALQKRPGRVGPPRRAALPDRAPVLRALAEARRRRGRRGDAPDRGGRPRRRDPAARRGASTA